MLMSRKMFPSLSEALREMVNNWRVASSCNIFARNFQVNGVTSNQLLCYHTTEHIIRVVDISKLSTTFPFI